ncbi:MFS transporter [Thermodesulfobium narugense]|uniref:MFS transporter n=1 Tax=Thermodesulfobium narugense TaxID=184064 RepID=UPI0002F6F3A1|nr:MFS transporter [Thermodesulfobium narugense]
MDKTQVDEVLKRTLGKRYFNVILPLFIASVLAFLDRLNLSYAALTMNKALGFTPEVFGFGAGILFWGYVLFEVPGAIFAAKWSASKWIVRILITWSIATTLMMFVKTPIEFYIVRFLIGAAEASFYPVCYAIFFPRWFAPNERARAISVMLTSLLVASILGSPLAGILIGMSIFNLAGWQLLFLVEGCLSLVLGIVLWFWIKDWPKDVNWLSSEEKKIFSELYQHEITAKNNVKKYTLWDGLKDLEVLKLGFIYFMWIVGFWGFGFWLPTVLKSVSGLSNANVSFLVTIPMVLSLIGFLIVGNSSSRKGEKRLHVALPLFIGAIGLAGTVLIHDPVLNFVFINFAAIGVYSGMGVWWSIPTTFLSETAAAGAIGLINSIGNIGGWVGPFLIGIVKSYTGSYTLAYLCLALCLIVSGILIFTLPKKRPTDSL